MKLIETVDIKGIVSFKLFSKDRKLIHDQTINNLVTDNGSNFLAKRLIHPLDTNFRYVQYIGLGEGSKPANKTDVSLDEGFAYAEIINQSIENFSIASYSTTFSEEPSETVDKTVKEVGLFTNFIDSNRILISRAVLSNPFIKSPTDFLIVNWKIKIG